MRRKLILILTFPLTFIVAAILVGATAPIAFEKSDDVLGPLFMFTLCVTGSAAMAVGSFFVHVPVALALSRRLPADPLSLMILLSLAATAATFTLLPAVAALLELQESGEPTPPIGVFSPHHLIVLLFVLLPGMIMSLIHVLVAFIPRRLPKAPNPTGTK